MSERLRDPVVEWVMSDDLEDWVVNAGIVATLVVGVTGLHLNAVPDFVGVALIVASLFGVALVRLDLGGARMAYRPIVQMVGASTPPLLLMAAMAAGAGNDRLVVACLIVLWVLWIAGPEEGSRMLERRVRCEHERL